MRKLIAISLLSLHLFGLMTGLVFQSLAAYRSDRFFEKQTSHGLHYKEDLTEIKIPVNMPGITDWPSYINMYGEVRFANVSYNYVRIRMTHNAVYLICIPNYSTTKLCGQNIIDARNMPNRPVKGKDHVPVDKIFSHHSAFNRYEVCYRFFTPVKPAPVLSCAVSAGIINSSITNPGEPPETC